MKPFYLLLTALWVFQPYGRSQVVVHDPIHAAIAIENSVAEIVKLVSLITELQTTKSWLGNAGKILDVAGLDEVVVNLGTIGVGQSRVDLAIVATSADGTSYSDDGLYAPVGERFVSRSGQSIVRPDVFKAESALFNAVRDHDAVYEDVLHRRELLRLGLQKTLAQLQSAATHAEVQKANGVLLAQHAELEATDRELVLATQKAVLLDLQNRADKERQEKARQQEQAQEFREGLRLFTEAVRPPMFSAPPRAVPNGKISGRSRSAFELSSP